MSSGRLDGRGVDADLVAAGVEDGAGGGYGVDAAAEGKGDADAAGDGAGEVDDGGAAFVGGGDVEEDEFVGALRGVLCPEGDGVAGVAEVDEVDAFDGTAVLDVETGDDAFGEHVTGEVRWEGRRRKIIPSVLAEAGPGAYLRARLRQTRGVMVTLLILVQSFKVRVLTGLPL